MGFFSWLGGGKSTHAPVGLNLSSEEQSRAQTLPPSQAASPSQPSRSSQPMVIQRFNGGGSQTVPLRWEWRARTAEELENIVQWLAQASLKQSPEPALNLAIDRLTHREWEQASHWLRAAADLGNTAAQAELAALHIRGFGMPKNEAKGHELLAKCGGIMPGLLRSEPDEYANSFHGKVPTMVVIHKHVYDPKCVDEWEFFAAPVGETFLMLFDMADEINMTNWSAPRWVEFGNGTEPGYGYEDYNGYYLYTTHAEAYFSRSLYKQRQEKAKLMSKFSV